MKKTEMFALVVADESLMPRSNQKRRDHMQSFKLRVTPFSTATAAIPSKFVWQPPDGNT